MPGADTPHKMWGGRFRQAPDAGLLEFTSSFGTDHRLLRWDIVASIAHVQMLGASGIIPASDAAAIADGLRGILADTRAGRVRIEGPYEDVHSFIEAILYQRIGPDAHRSEPERPGGDGLSPLRKRSHHPPGHPHGRSHGRDGPPGCGRRGDHPARLYPPAACAAGQVSPPSAGLRLDAQPRCRPPDGLLPAE